MKRSKTYLLVLIAALSAATSGRPAQAGENRWTPFGPDGGGLLAVAVDPRDGRTLYASAGTRVVKSLDGGESWQATSAERLDFALADLAINPSEPGRIFGVGAVVGGGSYGVWRSDDAGAHWRRMAGGDDFFYAQVVTVLPDGTVLVGSSQHLWRSTDRGETWDAVASSTSSEQFHSIAWSPVAPDTVFAASLALRRRSDDGGRTWTVLRERPTSQFQPHINVLVVAPGDPQLLYETGAGAISELATYRSRDGGATWEGPFRGGGDELLVDPRNPDVVYLGGVRGLFVSRDGAETFHRARRGVPLLDIETTGAYGVSAFAAAPDGEILAATAKGLLRSTDSGYHWRLAAGRGLHRNPVSFLRLDPHDPERWLLRSFDDFQATRDGGASFAPAAQALAGRRLNAVEFDPFVPGRLLAVAWGRRNLERFELLESRDGGDTWRQIGSPPPTDAVGLLFAGPRALITAAGNTIWRSQDGGGRWKPVLQAPCHCDGSVWFRRLVPDPSHPATFYALADVIIPHSGLPPRIYRSTDAGRHWHLWAEGVRALALDPNDPGVVYVAQNRSILRTRNQGRSFETMGTVPLEFDAVAWLVADRERSGVLYAATFASSVWRSIDRGRTWRRLPGLPVESGTAELAQDPLNPERLLTAPKSGGLWEGEFDLP